MSCRRNQQQADGNGRSPIDAVHVVLHAVLDPEWRYCGQLADSMRTDVTLKLVPVFMFDADGLVAWPGWVLPGWPGEALVPVPEGLPVVPVVVPDIGEADGLPNVPVTST